MSESQVDDVVGVFKALGDPTRVRIVALLLDVGELCVCDVESILEISQSKASRHLSTLRTAGLISLRREGAWVHYSVVQPPHPVLAGALPALATSLVGDPQIDSDRERARAYRRDDRCASPRGDIG